MKNLALLIGNGINNIDSKNSWGDIINDIIKFCKVKKYINPNDKSFPLLYEEVLLKAIKNNGLAETDLKKFISKRVYKMEPNKIHERISKSKIENIITTNYEFNLEGKQPVGNKGIIKEKYFSLFRHFVVNKKKYWHIHGDCNSPNSINLGYEHYGGQLQHIRNYVVSGTNYENESVPKKSFIIRFDKNDYNYDSWIELFFTHDIHIIGLTLDFVEIDLWWLITYRARQIYGKKREIKNIITYYYPSYYSANCKPRIEMFNAMGVKTNCITSSKKDKTEYYNKILDKILK